MNEQTTNKRQHQRFKTKERCLVQLTEGTNPYHLLDVSRGGIAFRYLGRESRLGWEKQVSLFFDTKLCIPDMPVEFVSDLQIQEGTVPYRRCGLKFGKLSARQEVELTHYIQEYSKMDH